MSLKTYKDGAWRTVKKWQIRQGNSWQTVKRARAFVGGAWREFYAYVNPMGIVITPPDVEAITSTPVASASVLATVTGGTAPISYVWSVSSFTAPITPTILNGTTAAPTLRQSGLVPNDIHLATFSVIATDSLGVTASDQVLATFLRT
jgi:hypothetical protein